MTDKTVPDDFMTKELACKLCSKKFSSLLVRRSRQPVLRTDSDFCAHYERETPYYYYVFVCPDCGYAYLESFGKPPEMIREQLSPLPGDFSGPRDAAAARAAYERAIACARAQRESDAVLASLNLQLAWICRTSGEEEAEQEALNEALAYYRGVYEHSDLADASKVTYLIGEINRRLGNPKEAVFWFSRVTNDEKSSAAMKRMARNAWQSLKD